jgi:hypothetical protein
MPSSTEAKQLFTELFIIKVIVICDTKYFTGCSQEMDSAVHEIANCCQCGYSLFKMIFRRENKSFHQEVVTNRQNFIFHQD